MTLLLVVVLAAVGAAVRGAIGGGLNRRWPMGTLIVNLVAAFALGLAVDLDGQAVMAVRIGLLGSLSTWSSLANETNDLVRSGHRLDAVLYLGGTLVGGIGLALVALQW